MTSILLSSSPQAGVALSLATATFWAISPLFMASVGRQIGALHTNLLRILLASVALLTIILPIYLLIHGPVPMPTRPQWMWLIVSGFGGMVIGDVFFYEALIMIGPRRTIKMNTLAPVFAIFLGYFLTHDELGGSRLLGIVLVIVAIMYATFRQTSASAQSTVVEPSKMSGLGFCCGVMAAFCTGLGSVLAAKAYRASPDVPLDRIVATTIRVGSATLFLWLWPLFRGQVGTVLGHLRHPQLRSHLLPGVAFGPLCGMICYISALQYAPPGLVSTLVATSPLITMPVMAVRYRMKIGWDIFAATAVAIVGVAIISMR